MPKSIKKVRNSDGYWERIKTGTKHRIGTRKGGKSANLMSSQELYDLIDHKNMTKYHNKARTVLKNRYHVC